ncbi:MAG TPA: 4-alpha-glucanotransferase, partial [Candidatus Obscuribacterales bacterium]
MKIDPAERLAGVLIPVFALRHKTDLGIGDTQAVKEAIDFCARNKIAILQVLPINESGGDNSPYSAISSIALDPALLTLSPDMVPGLDKKDLEKVVKDELAKELRQGAVRYPLVKKLKQQLLRCAFDAFAKANSKLMAEFDEFQRQNESWLKQYTLFRTIMDEKSGNSVWTQWEDELKNYDSALKWLEKHERSADLKAKRRFFAYVQWVAFKQWEDVRAYSDERGIKLMGDIPFGVSRYSADVWAHKDLFDLDWSGGAPPERFFQSDLFTQKWGQNWGVPTYKWEAHEAQNYQWWRQRIGHCTRIFHYFRIDHVLGFFRV